MNQALAVPRPRETVLGERSPEWKSWDGMIDRCCNPKNHAFRRYGGRGIRVCLAWRGKGGFARFLAHVGRKPSPVHSLDRIDVNGHYEPGNVRWATPAEQSRNTRATRRIAAFGRTMSLSEWSAETGLSRATIAKRLSKGDAPEHALRRAQRSRLDLARAALVAIEDEQTFERLLDLIRADRRAMREGK